MKRTGGTEREAAGTIKKEWTICFYRGNKCEIAYKKECVNTNTPVDNICLFFLQYNKRTGSKIYK